jgi:hypothetical protein
MAALDFSQFASQPSFGERYAQGQQQALQNELAKQQSQMQTENMLGLREERSALADQRRAATEGAAKRQAFLSGLGAKMSEGGHKLDRPTLSSMLQFGLMNKEGDVAKLATEGLRALDEEDAYKAESERLGTGATDQKFTPVQIQNMLVSPSIRIREQGKALAQMTPKDALLSPDVEAQRIRIEGAKRPDRLLTPEEEAQKVRLVIAGRTPAQPRAEPAPSIAQIVNPANPNEMISIDTRVYRGGGMGSPGVIGLSGGIPASQGDGIKPLTEQQTIKLRTDVAKDYKSASTTLSQMDDLLASIQSVKTAPGLSAATGYTGVYLPSFSEGKAAQADTRIANLRGKVTALGKATAAMTGAIGSIATQEWKILSDQVANIDPVKGKGPLLEQIDLIEAQARGAMERIRDQYEKTRAEDFKRFPQFKDLPAPEAPSAPVAVPKPGAPTRANAAAASASAGVIFLGFEPGTQ